MAEETKKDILSEHTKDMTPEEITELQTKIEAMTDEGLKKFRNSMNPDDMGFYGEECV